MKNFSVSSKNDLKFFLKNEKFKKIFVIGGKKSFKNSGASVILKSILKKKNTKYYCKQSPLPNLQELRTIIFQVKNFSPDLIIAVGGGSVLDYAKMANALTLSKSLSREIINSTYKTKKVAKLLAIPTTAGSGSEVTPNGIIYLNKTKYSVEADILKPDYFFLIPELVEGASNKIKASSGFDAIAQAIESLISKKSNNKSVNYAKKSLNISLKYFLNFLNNPNKENTSAMCLAANLSGKAISISKTTAPHAVSYPFTSIFNISHGHAVSITFNKFLNFNYKNLLMANCDFDLKKRYKSIFRISNTASIGDLDNFLIEIKKKARLEDNLLKLGIDINKSYSKIISGISIKKLSNNPVSITKKDLKDIIAG